MLDPRKRFSETAKDYDRYRPSYPGALLDWLLASTGTKTGAAVADIGCGTGISSRMLAERGLKVIGIDPNEEMLARAAAHGVGAVYRKGEAAATGLPDACVELVTAAQAFHWFDLPTVLPELRRVLKPGGWCAAFWNSRRTDAPFLAAYEALLKKYSADYREMKAVASTIDRIKAFPGVKDVKEAEFPYEQSFDRTEFLGRARSSSYVAHGIADRAAFDSELGRLFAAHAQGGRVAFLYRTLAVIWR